ncbi:Hsp20/alpha crystallin family protein [Chryseobacterium indoltheticum]|uniref:Hsp20/alpha crystallin family protein n=1 Tax=Chryseobacterium indoltheticum TaxID=254 RepID=UPI004041D4FD
MFQRRQQEENSGNYTRKEFSYQSFQRSFELSKDVVDDENIEARYENGVLRLTLPKKKSALTQPARLIEIQ